MTFAEVVAQPAPEAARALLGWTLLVDGVGGLIVETEAYAETDPASHSFRGRTQRTAVMFGPPGHLYVYRSYGIHWCANIVCDADGTGAAVLLRAIEPTRGLDTMRVRRGGVADRLLCAGPGRLTQALALTDAHGGMSLDAPPFSLEPPVAPVEGVATVRVGISRAVDVPWRFVVRGSPWVSGRRSASP